MTPQPPRCLVRSPLSTRALHEEYVKSLVDDPSEPLRGDGDYIVHERPQRAASSAPRSPRPTTSTRPTTTTPSRGLPITESGDVLP